MEKIIGLILIVIATIGGSIFLLLWRKFHKSGVYISGDVEDKIQDYLTVFSSLFLYGAFLWIFSFFPWWGNVLLSILCAWVAWWIFNLIGMGLGALFAHVKHTISLIRVANQYVQPQKKREKAQKAKA